MGKITMIFRSVFVFSCIITSLLFVVFLFYTTFTQNQFIASVKTSTSLHLGEFVQTLTDINNNPEDDQIPQYNIMFLFNKARNNEHLQRNIKMCISSLLSKASRPIIVHIIGDRDSFQIIQEIYYRSLLHFGKLIHIVHHDKNQVLAGVLQTVSNVHQQLSAEVHHFSDPIFYISLLMHRIMPPNITRLILLDVDLIFKSDIVDLFSLFDNFQGDQVIGIARENQPVYRNVFWEYRKKHPDSRIGDPPPRGLTGFNSGVVLFHLDKLRQSLKYNSFLAHDNLMMLVKRYHFKGHLGDQDFFTLLSFENESLFYILPCGWNRQLCTWWQRDDFLPIFHRYYSCNEHIHILHGNCNTSWHE